MTAWLEPVTLGGAHVRLEPLSTDHHDDLCDAVNDGELWKLWYTAIPEPALMRREIERRLDEQRRGTMCPFAVIEPVTGQAVGMTTYMNIDAPNRHIEIGSTHAFDELGCIAVEFRTHFFNHASRRAIERLGAKLDGVLRSHQSPPASP